MVLLKHTYVMTTDHRRVLYYEARFKTQSLPSRPLPRPPSRGGPQRRKRQQQIRLSLLLVHLLLLRLLVRRRSWPPVACACRVAWSPNAASAPRSLPTPPWFRWLAPSACRFLGGRRGAAGATLPGLLLSSWQWRRPPGGGSPGIRVNRLSKVKKEDKIRK